MNDKKRINISTPKGVAKYPWLNSPCKTFNPKGVYKTSLLLHKDSTEAKALMNQIDGWVNEAYQEAIAKLDEAYKAAIALGKGAEAAKKAAEKASVMKADVPYALDLDKDSGEETGYIEFKFKLDAEVVSKKTGKTIAFTPKLFDAAGNRMLNSVPIFGGSTIKVNFTPRAYYIPATKKAGITLQLNAVQVIELVSGTMGTSAGDFGFEAEEGYVYEAETSDFETTVPEEAGNF